MADPLPYVVTYSFAGYQANNPTTPLPGAAVDNEFSNAAAAIATLVSALEDIRRADGALNNGIVTFDSLEAGLQLLTDPTNGQLVAAAVAGAQASATAAGGSATAAAASAASALTQALAAAASAATVNLSLYLAKSNNLAGLGSTATSRSNLGLGSAAVLTAGTAANNAVQLDGSAKMPAVDGSQLTNVDILPVGAFLWSTGGVLAGMVESNGALLSRATYPRLWSFASLTAALQTEAGWASNNSGCYSTGDLATTFRVPDLRGEFIRGWDDSRGVDSGRTVGSNQADALKSHTHTYNAGSSGATAVAASGHGFYDTPNSTATGAPSTGAATETRPRNVALVGCIKY